MVDFYIDPDETQAYGPFATQQIEERIIGLDPFFDSALKVVSKRLNDVTREFGALIQKKRDEEVLKKNPVDLAQDLLRRLTAYASSRRNVGETLAAKILGGEPLDSVLNRSGAKLANALSQASAVVAAERGALAEADEFIEELAAVRAALEEQAATSRSSWSEVLSAYPEIEASRNKWLNVYNAAKLQVEVVLRLTGRTELLPRIFDDLADVHELDGICVDDPEPCEE